MELNERPVVAQLQVVRDRIRVIRKILNQTEQLKMKRPSETKLANVEEYDDDDETIYQAQKNLRDLINTLNSGKEDKYVNSSNYSNDDYADYSDDYYSNCPNNDFGQDRKQKKKRQLATISVQKAAFRQKSPKSHDHHMLESKRHCLDEYDFSVDSNMHKKKKRIFGLKNKKKRDLNLDMIDFCHEFNQDLEFDYSDYSSSCFYCPNCNCRISKRSKSPKGCRPHHTNRKRNSSVSRQHKKHNFLDIQTGSSNSSATDNCSFLDEYSSFEDEQIIQDQKRNEKKSHKSSIVKESISSYNTNTSTLLRRYASTPSVSLSSTNDSDIMYSSYDVNDTSISYYLDDDDDIDVEEILHNLEKQRRYITTVNDSYLNSISGMPNFERSRKDRAQRNKTGKRSIKENQSSSKHLSMSSKPRYKFDDSINSSCSILSDLLDEMSDEEERLIKNNIAQQSRKSKNQSQKHKKNQIVSKAKSNQKQGKQKQKNNSNSYSSKNEIIFNTKSEEEEKEQFVLSQSDKEHNQIIQKPINKIKQDINQSNKVKHTVKFILEEEEEDTLNNPKSSSNESVNKNGANVPLLKHQEEEEEEEKNEEEELKNKIFINSDIKIEEESLLELSSENSNGSVAITQKFYQNQEYSFDEEKEQGQGEEAIPKVSLSSSKSQDKEDNKISSIYKEEESMLENNLQEILKASPPNKVTSSSLYNDVDDIDIEEETANENSKVQSETINTKHSEEESLLIDMPQIPNDFEEEDEEDEIVMVNHLKDEGSEEDSEEENINEQFKFDEDNLDNSEEENENDQDKKSQHRLSDYMETGSINIGDDDFL
ncbi:hypothetical protein M9Y10_029713 [Tritrichomonas musculus]|uniref:Uncharacterized protein n=1 Tax=Tritrichomonas musculus TaxID=1915356 RepID=A0ABR2KMY2_9EUKA